ncbi:MAG: radical SAM protein [Candidatus Thorarchaeota archaeon]
MIEMEPLQSMPMTNRFLSTIMHEIRKNRPFGRREDFGSFTEATRLWGLPYGLPLHWFVTRGCSNDRAGGCTMCNFGWSQVSEADILWQIDAIARKVEGAPFVYLTPLGSMFDDAEVPPHVRERIFAKFSNLGLTWFGTESRVDTITHERMAAFREAFGDDVHLQVGLGLESADPYILRNCINKRISLDQYREAVDILHEYNIDAITHVLMKPAFLTEQEAIEDTVNTINWARRNGADRIVFFMTNVKPYTLLSWMMHHGMYRVPYLWSGIEVLRRVNADLHHPITLSGIYSGIEIEQLAHNCDQCSEEIIGDLQRFSMTLDTSILDDLEDIECSCRHEWERITTSDSIPLRERLPQMYEAIAVGIKGSSWWDLNRDWILRETEMLPP